MVFDSKYKTLQNDDKNRRLTIPDGLIISITIVLLAFPAWVRGGNIRIFLTPYPYLAVIVLFLFLLAPYLRRNSHSHGCSLVREQVRRILRDPVLYLGAAFLCLLLVQWWNSGKVRLFEQGSQKVTFSPPYIDWLPGAVDTVLSWDMVVWFFPAFVALLIVRHGFHRPRMVRMLFWGMVINASLLAIFGLIAPILVKHYPAWLTPILPPVLSPQQMHIFSTFGYANNAGSFFLLHSGLACGLFFYYSKRKEETRTLLKPAILLALILLFFLAVHLARCRYGILFSWMIGPAFMLYWLVMYWKRSGKQRKIKIMAIIAAALLALISFALYLGTNEGLMSKMSVMFKPGKFIAEQFDVKFWQTKAAAKMWLDYPVFGVGGRGYREYLLQYVTDPEKISFAKSHLGMAYVHNDFMQFLCEFGIVGIGLLLAVFFLLAVRIAASKEKKQAFFLFGLLGLAGVLVHSLIDLPFRSPPIIISFVVVLAGYGMLREQQEQVEAASEKGSITKFLTRFVNFYTILFLFVSIIVWWTITPIRKHASRDIVNKVEKEYKSKLFIPRHDHVTPWKSQNASPAMLRSLWWAKLLYSGYKDLHLLSAKINFDLYRNAGANKKKNAKSHLKEAFRSSLAARRFTSYADIEFIKLHTAILDSLGYILEQSWCLKCLRDSYPNNIRVNLLVREYYARRPYLIR